MERNKRPFRVQRDVLGSSCFFYLFSEAAMGGVEDAHRTSECREYCSQLGQEPAGVQRQREELGLQHENQNSTIWTKGLLCSFLHSCATTGHSMGCQHINILENSVQRKLDPKVIILLKEFKTFLLSCSPEMSKSPHPIQNKKFLLLYFLLC